MWSILPSTISLKYSGLIFSRGRVSSLILVFGLYKCFFYRPALVYRFYLQSTEDSFQGTFCLLLSTTSFGTVFITTKERISGIILLAATYPLSINGMAVFKINKILHFQLRLNKNTIIARNFVIGGSGKHCSKLRTVIFTDNIKITCYPASYYNLRKNSSYITSTGKLLYIPPSNSKRSLIVMGLK